MAPAVSKGLRSKARRRLLLAMALATLARSMMLDPRISESFAVPSAPALVVPGRAQVSDLGASGGQPLVQSSSTTQTNGESRTQRQASAEALGLGVVGQRVLNAMGAGAVASVIQAVISAPSELIINRVLVKRMKVMDAIRDVKPSMMLKFLKTTLITNFLKAPFFEGIIAFSQVLPVSHSTRAVCTALIYTSMTLPVTNYRYRKSMQREINWGSMYEVWLPTVIRDIAYLIVRNYGTQWMVGAHPGWGAQSPQVLFIVVIVACLGASPFNELRGFQLQSKGQELTFREFFKPANYFRSASLGACKQGLALAIGYWCAPPATRFVNSLLASWKH